VSGRAGGAVQCRQKQTKLATQLRQVRWLCADGKDSGLLTGGRRPAGVSPAGCAARGAPTVALAPHQHHRWHPLQLEHSPAIRALVAGRPVRQRTQRLRTEARAGVGQAEGGVHLRVSGGSRRWQQQKHRQAEEAERHTLPAEISMHGMAWRGSGLPAVLTARL